MSVSDTLYNMSQLLASAGYHAEEASDLTERLFDALIDMGNRQTATLVRERAETLSLPYAHKPYSH